MGLDGSAWKRTGTRPASRAAQAGFDGFAHGLGHQPGVLCSCHRGGQQHTVAAELHGGGGIRSGADAGIEDHWDRDRVSNDRQVVGVANPHAAADRRPERHDGGASSVGQSTSQDGIIVGVGQNHKAQSDQLLRRIEQLHPVGQQRPVVADDLELDPIGLQRLAGQLGGQDGVGRGSSQRCWAARARQLLSSSESRGPRAQRRTRSS